MLESSSHSANPSHPKLYTSPSEFVTSYLDAHPDITGRTQWTEMRVAPMIGEAMTLQIGTLQHVLIKMMREETKKRDANTAIRINADDPR